MPIKAICFDLDGVYYTPEGKSHFLNKLAEAGADSQKALWAFTKSPQMNEQYKRGQLTTAQFWGYLNDYLGLALTPDYYETILVEGYKIDPLVRADIDKVRSLGIKTCLCSNNFESRVRCLQNKFSFLEDFDIHVFSYQEGMVKPDPALFRLLVSKSGYQASQFVYADDKPENVVSAKSLGINAIQVVNYMDYQSYLLNQGILL